MATTPKAVRKQSLEDALAALADHWSEQGQLEDIEDSPSYWAESFADELRAVVAKHS